MSPSKKPKQADTILVVEDDPAARDVIARGLEKNGMRVMSCGEVRDALELMRDHTIDLICLDLALPIESGFSLCEAVRADPRVRDVPILVVTARTSLEDHARALELGANEVLTKPFRTPILVARVRALLKSARPDAAT